jgi:hypothetical protein
MFRFC